MRFLLTIYILLLSSAGIFAQVAESHGMAATDSFPLPVKNNGSVRPNKKVKIIATTLKDGTAYVGEVKGKRPHGNGKAVYKNGDKYEGEFVKGLRNGKGVYRFKDGEWYEGNFKADRQHGKGVYFFADGKKYDGDWANDYMHGNGRMD